jgi:predicted amidophosphoribosyltransferase
VAELIREHGWHVLGEIAVLVLATVVTILWIRALFRGGARPLACPSCGRVVSRAHAVCPRCGTSLGPGGVQRPVRKSAP